MAFFRPQSLRDYLELGRRLLLRKWLVLGVAAVVTAAIGVIVVRMPRMFTSAALILVDPGGIDPTRAPATVNVEGRLRNLRPMLTSRTTLETIIQDLNLYPDRRSKEVMDRVVDYMRKYVQVKVSGRDSFQVTFTHPNPKTAQEVCDRLSRMLINRSVSDDLKGARDKVDFLRKEEARLKEEVKTHDDKILQFKADNADIIGEVGPNAQSPLPSLSEELKTIDENLRAAQDRKIALASSMDRYRGSEGGGVDSNVRQLEQQEARQKAHLAQLQEIYTPEHPDVVKAKDELEATEAELKRARQSASKPSSNPQLLNIQREIDQVDLEIKSLRRDRDRKSQEIEEARARARINPVKEAQLQSLERDRAQVVEQLNNLGKELKQAEYDAQVLENEKGEQFRIQDWANLPQAPDPPSRKILLAIAAVLGLLSGVGVALVRVYFDQTIYNDYELARVTDLPVLVSIPRYGLPAPGTPADTSSSADAG
jgi:polysaccharide chain length determinant protein (PEP-CTERM system associated)